MKTKKELKYMFCKGCGFKCLASDCECICHTEKDGFNYDFEEGYNKAINDFVEECKDKLSGIVNVEGYFVSLKDLEQIATRLKNDRT